jgi:hypothetical protein
MEGSSADPLSGRSRNLLVNGSFEDPVVTSPESFDVFSSIPGWTASSGCGIEIQRNGLAGTPADGVQLVELDSNDQLGTGCNTSSAMFQDVDTHVGRKYELCFAYSPRPGNIDNRIEVSWEGTPLALLDGVGGVDTVWRYPRFRVTATSSPSRLAFADRGIVDTLGGYLDDVCLMAVDRDDDDRDDDDDGEHRRDERRHRSCRPCRHHHHDEDRDGDR